MRMKLFLLMIIVILSNTLLAQTPGFDEESLRGLNDNQKIEYIKNLHKMIENLQKDILQLRSDMDKYENDEKKELNNKIKLLQNDLKELQKNIISKLEKENDSLNGNLDKCKLGQDSLIMIFTDSIVNIKQYYIYCLDTLIKYNKIFIDSVSQLKWLTDADKIQIENLSKKQYDYLDSIRDYQNRVIDLIQTIPKKQYSLYSLSASLNFFNPSDEVKTSISYGAIFHLNLYPILGFWKDLGVRIEYIDPRVSKQGIGDWKCNLVSLGVCHSLYNVYRIQDAKFGIKSDCGVFWSESKRSFDRNLDTYCSGININLELNAQQNIKLFHIEIFISFAYYYATDNDFTLNIDYNNNVNLGKSIFSGALGLRFNVWGSE